MGNKGRKKLFSEELGTGSFPAFSLPLLGLISVASQYVLLDPIDAEYPKCSGPTTLKASLDAWTERGGGLLYPLVHRSTLECPRKWTKG